MDYRVQNCFCSVPNYSYKYCFITSFSILKSISTIKIKMDIPNNDILLYTNLLQQSMDSNYNIYEVSAMCTMYLELDDMLLLGFNSLPFSYYML